MERLRELRKERGLSMKALGTIVGVSESTISTYELGLHEPSCSMLCKLADALDTTTDYLLDRSNSQKPKSSARISEDEKQLIITFRSLNTSGRHALITNASIIAGNPDMQKDTSLSEEIS